MKLKNVLWGLGVYLAICGVVAFDEAAGRLQKGTVALAPHQLLGDLYLGNIWNSLWVYALMLILSVAWLQWSLVAYLTCLDLTPRPERRSILQAAESYTGKGFISHFMGMGWSCVGFAIVSLFVETGAAAGSPSRITPSYSFHAISPLLYFGLFAIGIGALAKVRGMTIYLMRQRPPPLGIAPEELTISSTASVS